MKFVQRIVEIYDSLIYVIKLSLTDLFLLANRLYISNIFFKSGWGKLANLLQGKWSHTVFLFQEVHPVPFLSPEMAATLGTAAEVIFPTLLALGIFARLGALGLLGVTAVISFGVHAHFTHVFWALLLGTSLLFGPGRFSTDAGLRYLWNKKYA